MLTPEMIGEALAKAVERYQSGRLGEAVGICQRLLMLSPTHAPSLRLLGTIALKTGHYADAADYIGRSAAQQPDDPDLRHLLSIAQLRLGHLQDAIASARAALTLGGGSADRHSALGVALVAAGRADEAETQFAEALHHDPNWSEAHLNLAAILAERRQWVEAIGHYREGLRRDPDNAIAHLELAQAFAETGEPAQAAAQQSEVRRLAASDPLVRRSIALALVAAGNAEEGLAHFREGVRIEPQSPEAHYGLALVLLLLGQLEEGWREYEWRWQTPVQKLHARPFREPQWQGEDVAGRTLVLHGEQGFGDTLHFCRYAPLVARRGAKVHLEVQPELARLLHISMAGDGLRIVPRAAGFPGVDELPPADYHCPLLSLPRVFGTRLATVPAAIPYLRADPRQATEWARRLAALPRPLVGLVWAGRPNNSQDRLRSIALARLAPLAAVPGVTFVSLQRDEAAAQATAPPAGMVLHDIGRYLRDFADTAAALMALDLVISVDTAVVHLAGALGRPVWVMNRRYTDWRWLNEGEESPWYPTLRLFRQPRHGDWESVIARVATELHAFAAVASLRHHAAAPRPPSAQAATRTHDFAKPPSAPQFSRVASPSSVEGSG